jgi:glycosidase
MTRVTRRDRLPDWIARVVCYEVTVPAYADSDGDGVGDLPGLTGRLDYLEWLGIDCLWLTDARGTPAELAQLVGEAHDRGIRVVADLPVSAEVAMIRTIRSWLELGLDGFRVDTGSVSADFLRLCRRIVDRWSSNAALLTQQPSALLPSILRALREQSGRCVSPLLVVDGGAPDLRIRRPAPLVANDRNRLELCAALLLSLPGIPVIYYGDEIGMAGHDGRPSPMQWSDGDNAGFSDCRPERIQPPVVEDVVYGYRAVNVESQRANRSSLLNWLRQMIAVRQDHPALSHGDSIELRSSNPRVLVYLRQFDESDDLVCVYNLSPVPQPFELDLSSHSGVVPVELTGGIRFPQIKDAPYWLTLNGYNFYWLRVQRPENWAAARAA